MKLHVAWVAATSLACFSCHASTPRADASATSVDPTATAASVQVAGVAEAPTAPDTNNDWDCEEYLRAGPCDPQRETPEHFRLRSFRRLVAQFEGEQLDAPDWPGFDRQALIPVVMSLSLQALQDAEDPPPAASNAADSDYRITSREGMRAFPRGKFPAWDEYVRLSGLDPQMTASFGDPLPPRSFEWPASFYPLAVSFAREAWVRMPGH